LLIIGWVSTVGVSVTKRPIALSPQVGKNVIVSQAKNGAPSTVLYRWRVTPGSFRAYAFAILLVALATTLRWAFGLLTPWVQAFTMFYPAVLLATLAGGAGPGVFVALLSAMIGWLLFLPPFINLLPLTLADEINLLTFLVASLAVVWATEHYRRLTKRLKDEEGLRKIAVDELAHRLKNKVATIQAIIAIRLRDNPAVRNEISGALAALMATDDLITSAQGKGAHINDILLAELTPYDLSRVTMKGRELLLPTKLALTFALLLHELATNAAKYGSLSKPTGKLTIKWALAGRRLNLVWRETDGPVVKPRSHSGFGTKLFMQALEQFDGTAKADFAPTGLICTIDVTVPENEADNLAAVTGRGA
jgi:two-component sensor histidine kinase